MPGLDDRAGRIRRDRHRRRRRSDDPADQPVQRAARASTRREFVRATHATYKLGIEFATGRSIGHRYVHPFGLYGLDMLGIEFHHHWLKGQALGDTDAARRLFARRRRRPRQAGSLAARARPAELAAVADRLRLPVRCRRSTPPTSAGWPKRWGVVRTEGRIVDVVQNGETGFVEAVVLAGRPRRSTATCSSTARASAAC